MATAVISAAAKLTALATPTATANLFILGFAILAGFGVLLLAELVYFAIIAVSAGRQTKFKSATTVEVLGNKYTFNEFKLVPLLTTLGAIIIGTFQLFFSSALSTARGAASFVLLNFRQFIGIFVLLGLIVLYRSIGTSIYPITTQVWNCEFGAPIRTIILPFAAFIAFILSSGMPVQNFISRFSKTATTSAIFRAVIGSFAAVSVTLMLFGSALLQFNLAQSRWVMQPTAPGQVAQFLVVGPDFNQTSHLVGDAIYNLRFVTEVACSPLQPYVFVPLLAPFDGEEFAAALNNTLNLFYVPLTQGILRPIAQYMVNLNANPSGTFGTLAPLPSFNSTIDTLNNAQRNWTRFADSFIPSLFDGLNVLLRDVTDVPLPVVAFPRRGLFTLFPGAMFDLVLRTAKLTQNLVFQIIFNSDDAFKYPEGIAIWKVDEILDGFLEYTLVITDYTTFVSTYMRELGNEFAAELTSPLNAADSTALTHSRTYQTLATEGELIQQALNFVANIIDKLPCVITTLADAVVETLKLGNDLAVGTIYTFMHAAFSARVASPFEYAQSQYGAYLNVKCVVHSTTLFTIPVLEPCLIGVAQTLCSAPLLELVPPFDYKLHGTLPVAWTSASQATLNDVGAYCDSNPCPSTFVYVDNDAVIPAPSTLVNRYDVLLQKWMQPIACIFDFIAKLCVGNDCPFSSSTVDNMIPYISHLILVPINLVIHTDTAVSTAYLTIDTCFPIADIPRDIQGIEVELTNALRRIINALVPLSDECANSSIDSVGSSSFLFCCALNFVDAAFGFVTDVAKQFISQLQSVLNAFLPVAVGGAGATSYTPPPFAINETWVNAATDAIACVPAQFIDGTERCTDVFTDFVQDRFQSAVSVLILEALLFFPRLAINVVNGVLNLVLSPNLGGVSTLLTNILTPVLFGIGRILTFFAGFLQCVDNNNAFSQALISIGIYFITTVGAVIPFVVKVFFAAFQFGVGVIALLQGNVAIIIDAASTLIDIGAGLLIAMLGQPFVCGTTEAFCVIAIGITPLITACNSGIGANGNDYGFTVCTPHRKRSLDNDCFQLIAEFGYTAAERISRNATTEHEHRVATCFRTVNEPGVVFALLAQQQKAQRMFSDLASSAPSMIYNHLEAMSREIATAAVALQTQQLDAAESASIPHVDTPLRIDFGLFVRSLNAKLSGDAETASMFTNAYESQHEPVHAAKRSLQRTFPSHENFIVNLAAATLHAQQLLNSPVAWRTKKTNHTSIANRVVLPTTNSLSSVAVGGALIRKHLQHAGDVWSTRIQSWVRAKIDIVNTPRLVQTESVGVAVAKQIDKGVYSGSSIRYIDSRGHTSLASWYASGDLVAPLAVTIDENLLPVVGLPQCDEMTQFICTDCKYIDDLIYVSEKSFNSAKRFYNTSSTDRGTFGYISAQLDRTLTDVLVNPGGTDTYATEPRTVVFITTRIWNIRWGFNWDRSEFLNIVTNTSVTCNFGDPFADVDLDQGYIDAFNKVLGNLVTFAEQATCQFSAAPAEISMRVFERYVMCDYDEALYSLGNKGSASVDGPQQLVDGFANAALVNVLVGTVVDLIPGTSMTFMMASPLWLYFGTLWFGYGSSPFCTLPGPFQMFGAYPVNLPLDAYGVLESCLPPSLPFPFALIDPTVRDHFATVKITTCGDVPPEINCTFYGFTGIYDNIFFSTGVLFGDSFNSGAASSVGLFSDEARASAAKFTEAYIAELDANHNAGDVCNRQTFLTAFIGLIALAGQLFVDVASALLFVPFLIAVAVIMFIFILLINKIGDQVDEYYIEDKRLDSPKE